MSDKNEQNVTEASPAMIDNKKAPDVFHPTLFSHDMFSTHFHAARRFCSMYPLSNKLIGDI